MLLKRSVRIFIFYEFIIRDEVILSAESYSQTHELKINLKEVFNMNDASQKSVHMPKLLHFINAMIKKTLEYEKFN